MNPIVEKILIAVLGGLITALLLATLPNAFKWIVRPAVPIGAVVAFNTACPDGWEVFKNGGGRFIVGAGEHPNAHSIYKIDATGGNETHTLTEAQMPAHSHTYTYGTSSGGKCGLSGCNGHIETISTVTSKTGESQPHNNLPPYVALQFCIRQ